MPLSNEKIPNKALSGAELRKLILEDVQDMLERDAMFGSIVAYKRVAATVRITVHLDNLVHPKHESHVHLKARAEQPEIQPLGEIKEPSSEVLVVDIERQRKVDNPNAARVAHGMPITINTTIEGKPATRELTYEPGQVANLPPEPPIVEVDRSKEATAKARSK